MEGITTWTGKRSPAFDEEVGENVRVREIVLYRMIGTNWRIIEMQKHASCEVLFKGIPTTAPLTVLVFELQKDRLPIDKTLLDRFFR